jgi:hypothetical protein
LLGRQQTNKHPIWKCIGWQGNCIIEREKKRQNRTPERERKKKPAKIIKGLSSGERKKKKEKAGLGGNVRHI